MTAFARTLLRIPEDDRVQAMESAFDTIRVMVSDPDTTEDHHT